MNQNLDMFGEIGQQVQQIRQENPNLQKQNKINIDDFAPRAPVVETVSKKKKKGRIHASLETDSDESEDPIAKAAAENERIKKEKEDAEKQALKNKEMQKLEESQLQNEIEGLLLASKIEKTDKGDKQESKQGSQKSKTSSQGVRKSSKGSQKQSVKFEK